jgi:metallophosphoesterase (TIGR00282 family)
MKILVVGDIVGTMGMKAFKTYLPEIKSEYKPNLIIVNGENSDKGFGINEKIYKELMGMGVNVVTLGNHAFSKRDLLDFIDGSNIIRPLNYGTSVPGAGYKTVNYNGQKITVINLMGRIFMGDPLDNPFKVMDTILEELDSDFIIVDFHAEATSEKIALAHYLDGRVTAVLGTHTHVPTADAMVFPRGLMYITDIGMSGTKYGILGSDPSIVIPKFIDGMPRRLKEDMSSALQFNAVILDTDKPEIKAINIYE